MEFRVTFYSKTRHLLKELKENIKITTLLLLINSNFTTSACPSVQVHTGERDIFQLAS